jgi:hypothetical protein
MRRWRDRGRGQNSSADRGRWAEQAARAYAGTAFTSDALERYADALAPHLPATTPRSTRSPAARRWNRRSSSFSYHVARQADRWIFARWGATTQHPRRALSGRKPLRTPYEAWLGGPQLRGIRIEPAARARTPSATRTSWPELSAPGGRPGRWAFVAELRLSDAGGSRATPQGYWPAIADCRRHGVLLVADEVMTGPERTAAGSAWTTSCDRTSWSGRRAARRRFPFGFVRVRACARRPAAGFVHGSFPTTPLAACGEVLDPRDENPSSEAQRGRSAQPSSTTGSTATRTSARSRRGFPLARLVGTARPATYPRTASENCCARRANGSCSTGTGPRTAESDAIVLGRRS